MLQVLMLNPDLLPTYDLFFLTACLRLPMKVNYCLFKLSRGYFSCGPSSTNQLQCELDGAVVKVNVMPGCVKQRDYVLRTFGRV